VFLITIHISSTNDINKTDLIIDNFVVVVVVVEHEENKVDNCLCVAIRISFISTIYQSMVYQTV
jgi:hypothetical protein